MMQYSVNKMMHDSEKTIPGEMPLKRCQRSSPVHFIVSDFRKKFFFHSNRREDRVYEDRKYTGTCEVESMLKLSSDIFLTFLGRRKKYYRLRQMMGEEVWEV